MATFLFWNIAQKQLTEPLARLVSRHEVDVLLLAECALTPPQILGALNRPAKVWQFAAPLVSGREKIHIFSRLGARNISERLDAPRWTMRELVWPNLPAVTLVAVHLPSKLRSNPSSQAFECAELSADIRAIEAQVGHERTLVVGDFNMNPFEEGMLAANGLHGESSRKVALARSRVVGGKSYPFFYNPMWNFWGDDGRGPGGTYFHRSSDRVRMSWNLFDQVLVRPDLLPFFATSQVQILETDGVKSFLTRGGTPTTRDGSDHLPVLFRLEF